MEHCNLVFKPQNNHLQQVQKIRSTFEVAFKPDRYLDRRAERFCFWNSCMSIPQCILMCALVLRLLLYPTSGFRTQAVESEIKIYQADLDVHCVIKTHGRNQP